ncbi:hypothetical protein GCM10010104_51670 [Streptomyces indiaensis]|uniref:Uncharacterized protein n=1 Tax=Streptomyces indiaensis TaxID=284033 RepID=A0ABN3E649_9ACTN
MGTDEAPWLRGGPVVTALCSTRHHCLLKDASSGDDNPRPGNTVGTTPCAPSSHRPGLRPPLVVQAGTGPVPRERRPGSLEALRPPIGATRRVRHALERAAGAGPFDTDRPPR